MKEEMKNKEEKNPLKLKNIFKNGKSKKTKTKENRKKTKTKRRRIRRR